MCQYGGPLAQNTLTNQNRTSKSENTTANLEIQKQILEKNALANLKQQQTQQYKQKG